MGSFQDIKGFVGYREGEIVGEVLGDIKALDPINGHRLSSPNHPPKQAVQSQTLPSQPLTAVDYTSPGDLKKPGQGPDTYGFTGKMV